MAEGEAATNALAAAMKAGRAESSTEAMDAAEQARQHISRWFYDCPLEMHRNLGDMYVSDERFTATYEKFARGLAQYVHDAIHANADRSTSPILVDLEHFSVHHHAVTVKAAG